MRRIVIALGTTLTGLTLLFSWPTSLNKLTTPSAPGAAAVTTSGPTAPGSTAKTYDGAAASTQYGDLQVRITVAGGVVTAAEAVSYPSSNGRDQQINAYAIPILNQEAVAVPLLDPLGLDDEVAQVRAGGNLEDDSLVALVGGLAGQLLVAGDPGAVLGHPGSGCHPDPLQLSGQGLAAVRLLLLFLG